MNANHRLALRRASVVPRSVLPVLRWQVPLVRSVLWIHGGILLRGWLCVWIRGASVGRYRRLSSVLYLRQLLQLLSTELRV
jgi:hypothetical protein